MPIDRSITHANPDDELLLVLHDPHHEFSYSEICDLIDQAEALGFDLQGPELRHIHTARQLATLVHRRQ